MPSITEKREPSRKELNKIKKPSLKADALKHTYNNEIQGFQDNINRLEKARSNTTSGALYAIFFLLAIAAAVATLIYLIRNVDFKLLLHLGAPAVAFVVVILIAVVIDSIAGGVKKKKLQKEIEFYQQRIKDKKEELAVELSKVANDDKAAQQRYNAQRQEVINATKAEFAP